MKNVMTNLMIAAAAFVALAGTASAQIMEAKIPFAFRASDKVLPPGTYKVELRALQTGDRVLVITNPSGKHRTFSIARPNGAANPEWKAAGDAVLSFQCGVSRCAMKDIWMGSEDPVYVIPVHKIGHDDPAHTAEIVLHAAKVD